MHDYLIFDHKCLHTVSLSGSQDAMSKMLNVILFMFIIHVIYNIYIIYIICYIYHIVGIIIYAIYFQLVLPEYGVHIFFNILFLFAAQFGSLMFNVPLIAYHVHR